ncbi:MAG: hypothetical protein M3313_02365 [Actinomycetota bacterium]|nr:hypothetical protein [Actinomycetota bacterium]
MTHEQTPQQPPTPSAQLAALRRLVGTWTGSGGAAGRVTYEFLPGEFFLQQRVELEGDSLLIWAGEKGSPAHFEGRFSADDSVVAGEWVYPGGGGYSSTMTRLG